PRPSRPCPGGRPGAGRTRPPRARGRPRRGRSRDRGRGNGRREPGRARAHRSARRRTSRSGTGEAGCGPCETSRGARPRNYNTLHFWPAENQNGGRMEKLVYLLWRDPAVGEAAFAERLERIVGPRLCDAGARSVATSSAPANADLGGSVPIRETGTEFHGLVSFWLPCVDDRLAYEAILRDAAPRLAGYLVTESVPRDFDRRTWP